MCNLALYWCANLCSSWPSRPFCHVVRCFQCFPVYVEQLYTLIPLTEVYAHLDCDAQLSTLIPLTAVSDIISSSLSHSEISLSLYIRTWLALIAGVCSCFIYMKKVSSGTYATDFLGNSGMNHALTHLKFYLLFAKSNTCLSENAPKIYRLVFIIDKLGFKYWRIL